MSQKKHNENGFIKPDKDTLTYDKYLKIHELLSLQEELTEPKAHDETLFIIIHQVYELWFKQVLHEIYRCQKFVDQNEILPVLRSLKRVDAIQKVLIQQINVLETMAPDEFNHFRSLLNPASGFQSHQFRVLEFLLGLKNPGYFKYFVHEPETTKKLQAAFKAPSLYDSFLGYMHRAGYDIPDEVIARDVSQMHQPHERIIRTYTKIYQDHLKNYEIYAVLEALMDLDEQFIIWRYRHMMMVERMIGSLSGTGGSLGAKYLATTLEKRLFPELWEVRNNLGSPY